MCAYGKKESIFFFLRAFLCIVFSRIIVIGVVYACGILFSNVEILYAQSVCDTQNNTITNSENTLEKSTTIVNEKNLKIPEEDNLNRPSQKQIVSSPLGIWDILRVFFVLTIVIVVVYIFLQLLKKFQRKSLTNPDVIEILSNTAFSGGASIHLVKLGNSLFLLGISGQTITLIKEISKKEEIDEIQLLVSRAEEGHSTSFSERIREIFSVRGKNKEASVGGVDSSMKHLLKRVHGIFGKNTGEEMEK